MLIIGLLTVFLLQPFAVHSIKFKMIFISFEVVEMYGFCFSHFHNYGHHFSGNNVKCIRVIEDILSGLGWRRKIRARGLWHRIVLYLVSCTCNTLSFKMV